jgi:hypothetical protein
MDKIRAEKWQQLINLLHEADAIQQQLLGDEHPTECYEFHSQLNNIAEEFECWAADEEQSAAISG